MSVWITLMPHVFDRRDYVRYGCGRNNYCDSGDCLARATRVKRVSSTVRFSHSSSQTTSSRLLACFFSPRQSFDSRHFPDSTHRDNSKRGSGSAVNFGVQADGESVCAKTEQTSYTTK